MRGIRGWMLLVMLWAGAAGAEEARLAEAQRAFDEAGTRWDAGRYDEALARGEQALALREAMLGGAHPDVARSLDWLGAHHLKRGNPVRAEPLLQRALAVREAALGKDHPEVAQTLHTLATLYTDQELYNRAEPLLQRALAVQEASLGKEHPEAARTLGALAKVYADQALFTRAEPLQERVLAIREAALGEHHPLVAESLSSLAINYQSQGLYGRSRPLLERALAIWATVPHGEEQVSLAEPLVGLFYYYRAQGAYARAEPLLQRAVALWEAALDKNPPDVAWALENLAFLYGVQGLYARSERLALRVLAMREQLLGGNHLLVAHALQFLALLHINQGRYGQAEPLLERALAIWEPVFGKEHPLVAGLLYLLGKVHVAQGFYARAEPLLTRVLAIREAAFSEEEPRIASSLIELGRLHLVQGQYARAEPLLLRALALLKAVYGERSFATAWPLSELGRLYVAQGLYHRAEPLLLRALALREAAFGREHPEIAPSLNYLAGLYSAQGLYARARPLLERVLAIQESTAGKSHPSVAATLNHLAMAHLAEHRLTEALPLFTRAFNLSEQRLRQEALGFSEVRLGSFLKLLRTDEERLYALLRAHPGDAHVRRLALRAVLLLKGRSVEESAGISRTVYRSLGEHERDTFERLSGLRTQLAQLSLQGLGSIPPKAYQRRLEELSEQATALEADLARRSAPLRALTELPPPEEIVKRVATALPGDAALVELISYEDRPLVPAPGAPGPQLRYLALVLFPDASIRVCDLGPAGPIDSAAARLRDALANREADFQASAQDLYQLAFQPLLPLLGATRRLFLSPDGQLAQVPFAALHDGRQFLVDGFDFTYVSSGRSLLPRPQQGAPPASVVVLADPDFRAVPSDSKGEDSSLATRGLPSQRFLATLREHLAARAWSPTPLPGTRQEAEAIQRLLPQAQLFLGAEATRQRLLQLPAPGILHLATHGFFLEDAPGPPASRGVVNFGELGEDAVASSSPDPLLRSGLLLAGADAPEGSGASIESSLVTALELAGLDLWGTQLVVLSACDTGRGDVKLGQGVYGMRRAFLVAGAETVVMSLWKVDDAVTRELMEAYYRQLLAGQGRAEALQEAMRELRRTQPHPHYWAPFIVMGRETPLRLYASGSQQARR